LTGSPDKFGGTLRFKLDQVDPLFNQLGHSLIEVV
jgi:hypothetical protein